MEENLEMDVKTASKRICASYLWFIGLQFPLAILVIGILAAIVGPEFIDSETLMLFASSLILICSILFIKHRYQKIFKFKVPMALKAIGTLSLS